MSIKETFERYPQMMTATAAILVSTLSFTGVNLAVEFPSDIKMRELEKEFATFQIAQNTYNKAQETKALTESLQNIRWQKQDIHREIARLRSIGSYSDRGINAEEQDHIDELKAQLELLRDLEQQTMQQLKGN